MHTNTHHGVSRPYLSIADALFNYNTFYMCVCVCIYVYMWMCGCVCRCMHTILGAFEVHAILLFLFLYSR